MERSKRRSDRAIRPQPDACEARCLLSLWAPTQKAIIRTVIDRPGYTQLTRPNTIGVPQFFLGTTAARFNSFVDPTVQILNGVHIVIKNNTLVAPFALLDASLGFIKIGAGSEIADSARLIANPTHAAGAIGIQIGGQTLIGANATVLGPSRIGGYGNDAFTTVVGAGALIDGATIQPGAVVSELARVGPGVTVPTGYRVLPGKNVTTNAEASNPALGKVVRLGTGDPLNADVTSIANARAELAAASTLAQGYAALYAGNSSTVLGSGPAPGGATPTFLNPRYFFLGTTLPSPQFRGRATGTVNFGGTVLQINPHLGFGNSFRADPPNTAIAITSIARTGRNLVVRVPSNNGTVIGTVTGGTVTGTVTPGTTNVTGTFTGGTVIGPPTGRVTIGGNFTAGDDVTILGGPVTPATSPPPTPQVGPTVIGDYVTVQSGAIVDLSTINSGATVGARSFVFNSNVPLGATVPPRTVLIRNVATPVEW